MKTILLCAMGLCAAVAKSQVPVFVGVPRAGGSLLPLCLDALKLAHQKGFQGVAVHVGPSYDPARPTVAETKRMMHTAMSLGLKVNASFAEPPANAYWLPLAGDQPWLTPTRPPSGPDHRLWQAIADDRSAHIEALCQVARYYGKDASTVLSIEPWNEVGKGGIAQPKRTDGTFEPKYAKLLGGQIERGWFEYAFWVEKRTRYQGVPNLGLTLEGASGEDQRRELQSFVEAGSPAMWLVKRWQGIGFNCYAPSAATPGSLSSAYKAKIAAQVALMKSNPVVGHLPAHNQECNVFLERVPEGADAGLFRVAAMQAMTMAPGIRRATAFTLVSTNKATENVALFSADWEAWPVGSTALSVQAIRGVSLGG